MDEEMRMRKGCAIAAFFALLTFGVCTSRGAVITYTLSVNDNGAGAFAQNDFAVYADDSTESGNHGIASFYFSLSGYSTIVNMGPETTFDNGLGQTSPGGFALLRSAINVSPVTASQELPGSGTDIYGYGQTAGNFAAKNPYAGGTLDAPTVGDNWSGHLLLATGTYSGAAPGFSTPNTATYYTNTSGSSSSATTINLITVDLPEPGMMGLLMIGAIGMLMRRRRGIC